MAPERKNTVKLKLDTIASIRGLLGSSAHAHGVLRLGDAGISVRRFNNAVQHSFITSEERSIIENVWMEWKYEFIAEEKVNLTDFALPPTLMQRALRNASYEIGLPAEEER